MDLMIVVAVDLVPQYGADLFEVRDALQAYSAVHLSAVGGAGALLSKHILGAEIIAFKDLGTEAVRRLQVEEFPAVVAYDAHGGSVYRVNKHQGDTVL